MSNRVTNAVKHWKGSPSQKAVLMCLSDRADDHGRWNTSYAQIQVWTCLGRTAVIDAVKVLEARGLVTIQQRAGYPSSFKVNFELFISFAGVVEEPWLREIDSVRSSHAYPSDSRTSSGRQPDPDPAALRTHLTRLPNGTRPPGAPNTSAPPTSSERRERRARAWQLELDAVATHAGGRKVSASAGGIPRDFAPDERGRKYARERGLVVDQQLTKFLNYYQSKGETRSDWQAAWRAWCDKCPQFERVASSSTASQMTFQERDSLNRMLRRLELPFGYIQWSELSRAQTAAVRAMLDLGEIESGRIVNEAPVSGLLSKSEMLVALDRLPNIDRDLS